MKSRASILSMTSSAMEAACQIAGGAVALSRELGVTVGAVNHWRTGVRPFPFERCVQIERITAGRVRRWDLRPDDWDRVWPELIGAPGAPKIKRSATA